jgi:hypothetical protein
MFLPCFEQHLEKTPAHLNYEIITTLVNASVSTNLMLHVGQLVENFFSSSGLGW